MEEGNELTVGVTNSEHNFQFLTMPWLTDFGKISRIDFWILRNVSETDASMTENLQKALADLAYAQIFCSGQRPSKRLSLNLLLPEKVTFIM
jgi:hypothetical protein